MHVWELRSQASQGFDQQIDALSQQVTELQEMMMLSMLEKGSATERLKAVGLTREMDEASKKVTNALIETLNHDENVNVRLAALDEDRWRIELDAKDPTAYNALALL